MDLSQLQRSFKAYLLGDKESLIVDEIISDANATASERMDLYHDAYRLRLIEVLSFDYPGLHQLLGEEQFAEMALVFIRKHPSTFRSIRWFGIHLPEFLAKLDQTDKVNQQLYEMAQFEKAQNDVFDQRAEDVFTLDEMLALAPEQWESLRLEFVAAHKLIDLHYNVPKIWQELHQEEIPADYAPEWHREEWPSTWLVWRVGLEPRWKKLDVDEAWCVQQFVAGASFAEVCGGLIEWMDEAHIPLRAASILKTLVVEQLVTQVHTRLG